MTQKKLFYLLSTIFLLVPLDIKAATFPSSIQILTGNVNQALIGTEFGFKVVTNGNGSAITYTLSDSFSGTSITNADINSSGLFYWTPRNQDGGTHLITVNLIDELGNTSTASQQIIVPLPLTAAIQNLTPGSTVNVGQTVFFNMALSGFTNPTYTLSDSVNSTISSTNLNSSGSFSWTPKNFDVGNHAITVVVTNNNGLTATASQNITVGIATASIQSLYPGDSVNPKQDVTFTIVPSNFTDPTYSVSDSIGITTATVNSSGVFSWSPTINDLGAHLFTIKINDSSGNVTSITQKITVTKAAIATGIPNEQTIKIGTPLIFNISVTGLNTPTFIVNDSFGGSTLTSKNITVGGNFNWTPGGADVGVHNIDIRAQDNSGNIAETNFTVTVTSGSIINNPTVGQYQTPTNTKKYIFTKALSPGSTGTEVSELQKKLSSLGLYSGPITATFGPLTKASVKKLQAKYKLDQIGNVGPGTRNLLNSL